MPTLTTYTTDELAAEGLHPNRLPRHIAVIMDGNGRWATSRGLPRIEGHRRGVKSVRLLVEECCRLGIEQLTLYCFSSENWKRPRHELSLLMHLLEQYVIEERSEIMRQQNSLHDDRPPRRTGQRRAGAKSTRHDRVQPSEHGDGLVPGAQLWRPRSEIVDAVREIARKVAVRPDGSR